MTRFSLEEQGAGFVTTQEDDLLRTTRAPSTDWTKQGPDGALILLTGQTRSLIMEKPCDERRDRWHGRIWRVTRTGSTPKKRKTLPRLLRRTYCLSSFLTIDIHVIKRDVFSWSEAISQKKICIRGPKHLWTNTRNCRESGFSRDSMLLIFKMFKRWHLQTTQKSDRRQCVLSVIWLIQQQIVSSTRFQPCTRDLPSSSRRRTSTCTTRGHSGP